MNPYHIVIVGGGAGGLELATKLGNTLGKKTVGTRKTGKTPAFKITLVDSNPTHIWKPRLHEVATGVLNATVDELSYAAHAYLHNLHFVLGKMEGIDRENKQIKLAPFIADGDTILPSRTLDYDALILAVGSNTNDFRTLGASEHCIFLDKRSAAERFHQAFLNMYLKASQLKDKDSSKFNIAIVGAGATGVELAAALNHSAHQLVQYGFNRIKPQNVTITIVEAADRAMSALSPKASAAIQNQLRQIGVQLLTNEMVTEVTAEGLHTKSGKFIPAELKVWSAGVIAPTFLANLGLETNRINQLVVRPTLQTSDDNIFALGDCANCHQQKGSDTVVPPRAQAAHQQAMLLAKSLQFKFAGKPLLEFVYKDKGSLVSLGKRGTIGNIMGNLSADFTFEGKIARFLYISLYRLHQYVLHGGFKTALIILRDLLNRETGPTVKLH